LFAGCRKSELANIARIAYEHQVPEGTVLVTEGVFPSWVMSRGSREEAASEFSIIVSGRAISTKAERAPVELGPGQFFGYMALLDGGPRTATVTAATPMVLLSLTRDELLEMLDEVPRVGVRMMIELVRRVRAAEG